MISIVRYSDEKVEQWNQFNKESKNPLFMFDRKYMDYHKDRFKIIHYYFMTKIN